MATTRTERLAAKLARYTELSGSKQWWDDPVRWVNDCVLFPDDGRLTPYQERELSVLASDRRVSVRGPRGSGKTMPAALAFWWFACTRERAKVDWKIPTTAGSWAQVSLYLWPEIRKWARLIDWDRVGLPVPKMGKDLLSHHLRWDHGEGFGRATDDPNLIEGAHASQMLVIIDEGKSVTDGIWDAVEGFFANPGQHYLFALSTPGAAVGRFYDIHARTAGYEDWTPIHVTIDEAIDAGRITRSWQEQRLRQWGQDSVSYQCHVLAEFGGDDDGVIPLAWVDAAVERWHSRDIDACVPRVIAADIADTGTDSTVLAYVDGTTCYRIETFDDGDVLQHGDRIAARTNEDTKVTIDSIGVGAGTLARAIELRLNASGFVASERTTRRDRTGTFGFINKRAAAWWNLRERLDPDMGDDIALPDDPILIGDLTAPTWREAAGGKIQIESKTDIKKRLGRSTDTGDAVVMALWNDKRTLIGDLMV